MNTEQKIYRGSLELAREHIEAVGREVEKRDGSRLTVLQLELETKSYVEDMAEWNERDVAYELRDAIANYVGFDKAQEDGEDDDADGEYEDTYAIPLMLSCLHLATALGDEWLRLSYIAYLTHFADVPCADPEEFADVALARIALKHDGLRREHARRTELAAKQAA